ncbi:MAG TPA: Cof-type HAD-IIB family hydrolase [Bacilli bacterium]|nr:Cof-type HAD-IIB family hydrolase [Bacilli bacterium]
MQKPKAIFLDMDGTMLNNFNRVTENTKNVIDEIRKLGIYVFIVTGRGKNEIFTTTPEGFEVDGVISSNGMTGYLGDKKLFEYTLPFHVVEAIVKLAQDNQIYYELFPTDGSQIVERQDEPTLLAEIEQPMPDTVGINEWREREEALAGLINWVDKVPTGDYSKFYFFSRSPEKMQRWISVLREQKRNLPFSMTSSSLNNVEVMVKGKNKGTAIQEMIDELAITADEILAIGDSYNDESMFKLAGHTVAMKNAPVQVQAMTDEVTAFTNDEEGLYHYLKKLLLDNK